MISVQFIEVLRFTVKNTLGLLNVSLFGFVIIVFPGLRWLPFFANYSLMVILIEKLIRKMNLDIYRVIEFIFST